MNKLELFKHNVEVNLHRLYKTSTDTISEKFVVKGLAEIVSTTPKVVDGGRKESLSAVLKWRLNYLGFRVNEKNWFLNMLLDAAYERIYKDGERLSIFKAEGENDLMVEVLDSYTEIIREKRIEYYSQRNMVA